MTPSEDDADGWREQREDMRDVYKRVGDLERSMVLATSNNNMLTQLTARHESEIQRHDLVLRGDGVQMGLASQMLELQRGHERIQKAIEAAEEREHQRQDASIERARKQGEKAKERRWTVVGWVVAAATAVCTGIWEWFKK
jgi:hypothetical protein